MTTNIDTIQLSEAESDYYDTIDEMIDQSIMDEVAGHAAAVKERYAEYRRYVALAESGALCRCCGYRLMATEGSEFHGQGVCDSCGDYANSLYQDFLKG